MFFIPRHINPENFMQIYQILSKLQGLASKH